MEISNHDATGSNSDLRASSASPTLGPFGLDEAIQIKSMRKQGIPVAQLVAEVNARNGTNYSPKSLAQRVSRLLKDFKPDEIAAMIAVQRDADGAPTADAALKGPDAPAGEAPSKPGIVPPPQPIPEPVAINPTVSAHADSSSPQTVASGLPAVVLSTTPLTQSVPPPVASTNTLQTVTPIWDRTKPQADTIAPSAPKTRLGYAVPNPPTFGKMGTGNPVTNVQAPKNPLKKLQNCLIGILALSGLAIVLILVAMLAGMPIFGRSIILLDKASLVVPRAPSGLTQKEYNAGIVLFAEFAKSPEPGLQTQLATRQAGLSASYDATNVALLYRLIGVFAGMPPEEQAIAWDRMLAEAVLSTKRFHAASYLHILQLPEPIFQTWFAEDAARLNYIYAKLLEWQVSFSGYGEALAAIEQAEQQLLVLRKDLEARRLRLERERSPAVKPRP